MWNPLNLSAAEVKHLHDFIEELEALIDADDGTCFACKHIDMFETIKEIVGYVTPDDEEDV